MLKSASADAATPESATLNGAPVLEVPRVLADCTDGRLELPLSAPSLPEAFAEMRSRWPLLATHVFEESGAIRPHVLVLYNGPVTRWMPDLAAVALRPGDRVQIVQAVSGG